jgi:hypothetical protein
MTSQSTIRRLDEEITERRQRIAALQVEIARLEDSRRVFMSLMEADQHAAETRAHRAEGPPPGLTNGSHAKPMLIVRKTTQDSPPPAAEKKVRKPRKSQDGSKRAAWREKLLKFFGEPDTEPMTMGEIANFFGVPPGAKSVPRKDLANAIYYMQKAGTLQKDGEGRYFTPTRQ